MSAHNILVPMDFSHNAEKALDFALRDAEGGETSIHLLYVAPIPVVTAPMMIGTQVYPTPTVLEEARHRLEDVRGRIHVQSHVAVEEGNASELIVRYAQSHDIDLIVMATHGRRGIARFFLGSTTEHVLRRAPCPVLIIPPAVVGLQPLLEEIEPSLQPHL